MTTKQKAPAVGGGTILRQPPEGDGLLLIRNVSNSTFIISPDKPGMAEFAIRPQQETVVAKENATNRNLQKPVQAGDLVVSWVAPDYQVRELPRLDEAPDELLLNLNDYEKQFAYHIAASNDTADVVDLASNTKARRMGDGREDMKYTKDRLRQILKLAEWLEQRMQNRQEVLEAIDQRVDVIRAM